MNGALRQVRVIRQHVDSMNRAKTRRHLWKNEDGSITDGPGGLPVLPEEISENDLIFTWDWDGRTEPPVRQDIR